MQVGRGRRLLLLGFLSHEMLLVLRVLVRLCLRRQHLLLSLVRTLAILLGLPSRFRARNGSHRRRARRLR